MAVSAPLWGLLRVPALSRLIRSRVLAIRRPRAIGRLQQARGGRVIALIHRQETVRLPGFPVLPSIDIEDSEVHRPIRLTHPEVPIDIIVLSGPGASCWRRSRSPGPSRIGPAR